MSAPTIDDLIHRCPRDGSLVRTGDLCECSGLLAKARHAARNVFHAVTAPFLAGSCGACGGQGRVFVTRNGSSTRITCGSCGGTGWTS